MNSKQAEPNEPTPSACVRYDRVAAEEVAVLYALGSLEPAEALRFEEHMARECPVCAREAAAWKETVGQLAESESAAGESPPGNVRRELMDRISKARAEASKSIQVWKDWTGPGEAPETSGFRIVRSSEGGMQPTGVPGVTVKQLSTDRVRRSVTMLVRMEPGSAYPSHRHGGAEECYVLEGDLRVGEHVLRTGDYQYADEKSLHGVQSTEKGCLLLIVSSQDDELV